MKLNMGFAAMTFALLVAGSALVAAPGQEYTGRPGDPTQAKVWIQNTPLGVEIQNVPRVEVSGVPTVTLSAGTVVQARLVRQNWEYRVVTVPQTEYAGTTMAGLGADGWEATGVQWQPNTSAASLLLKRPR